MAATLGRSSAKLKVCQTHSAKLKVCQSQSGRRFPSSGKRSGLRSFPNRVARCYHAFVLTVSRPMVEERLVLMKIAILGGTGKLGLGLAIRLSHTGHEVTIGSRQAGKAEE